MRTAIRFPCPTWEALALQSGDADSGRRVRRRLAFPYFGVKPRPQSWNAAASTCVP